MSDTSRIPDSIFEKTLEIKELLLNGHTKEANQLYLKRLSEKEFISLDVIVFMEDFFQKDIINLPDDTQLLKDIHEHCFLQKERLNFVFSAIGYKTIPSFFWWCNKVDCLSSSEKEDLFRKVGASGLIRVFRDEDINDHEALVLIERFPNCFWVENVKIQPRLFQSWLSKQQDDLLVSSVVEKLTKGGLSLTHPIFQTPSVLKHILKKQTKGIAESKKTVKSSRKV